MGNITKLLENLPTIKVFLESENLIIVGIGIAAIISIALIIKKLLFK